MRTAGLFFVSVFFISFFSFAQAQTETSEFNVRQTIIGTDVTPPTTPTLLSADPISFDQIDIDWTDSTDDFTLWGYVVFRDTVPIATTTLSAYSDTGLSASTTYAYFVQAFDAASNYSSSSNSLSTTTLQAPVVATSTTSAGQGTVARVVAEEVIVTPDVLSASFDILTSFPARFEIRWGRTAAYELGYVGSDILRRSYSTVITDLEPGTRYEYEIIGYTQYGKSNVIDRGQFQTLDDIDLTVPANVSRFAAITDVGDVNLSWQLPEDDDLAYVRIVRSHLGYPDNPNDGAVVYQGLGTEVTDIGVLFNYSPAYYTAFVYDQSGNVSSGAIAIAYAEVVSDEFPVSDESGLPAQPSQDIGSDPSDVEVVSTNERMPDAFDILIKQASQEFSFGKDEVELDRKKPFIIYLDAEKVTRNLKSIIVTLQDPTDQRQSFSFLLRLNKDQTAYEATIAPLGLTGRSSLVLSIYDFRAFKVADYRTQIVFTAFESLPTSADLEEDDKLLRGQYIITALALLVGLLWWLLAKRRTEDKGDNPVS